MGEFGGRLKRARNAAGLTQQELAEEVGLTQAAISQLEKGVRAPTPALVVKLADALGVKKTDLAGQSEGQFERKALFRNLKGLSPDELRFINEVVERIRKSGE